MDVFVGHGQYVIADAVALIEKSIPGDSQAL